MTKTTTKTNTQTKCLKNPIYAIFLKSWWLTHSKYDDRYLTLVILFTPVTLVTLFRLYNQFYRAECITVSAFFFKKTTVTWNKKVENRSQGAIWTVSPRATNGPLTKFWVVWQQTDVRAKTKTKTTTWPPNPEIIHFGTNIDIFDTFGPMPVQKTM